MGNIRIHYIQHVHFEGLGEIAKWAEDMGHKITSTKVFQGEMFPSVSDFDWLVIMGGPMSVYDDQKYPWLFTERMLVCDAIMHNKVVLGVCLGAQIIARCLGANVYPNTVKEIGWWNVQLAKSDFWGDYPSNQIVFQWHGDTFDIPNGAQKIATSVDCTNQGFVFNNRVLALQFHLEVSAKTIVDLYNECSNEIVEDEHIHTLEQTITGISNIQNSNEMLFCALNRLQDIWDSNM